MDIWKSDKWQEHYLNGKYRKGIKIDFDSNVNISVKQAIKNISNWLRKNYIFPIRLRIYVKSNTLIKARDGSKVPDLFFWPYNRDDEPYIKIATGDYDDLLKRLGKDDALATILFALLRNITHYFQWLNDTNLTATGEQRQATRYARIKLHEYAETREHP